MRTSVVSRITILGLAAVGASNRLAAQAVRDSAGIQIVENRSPSLPANRVWRVEPKPMLSIGDQDGPMAGDSLYEFSRVMGVVRFDDGRIAAGVQASGSIRFFDAGGKFLKSAGRAGQGPGEFGQIMGVVRAAGDTLVVTDLGEVEFYTSTGSFVAQGASRRSSTIGNFIWPLAVFPDRSYAGIDFNDRSNIPTGRVTLRLALYRISAGGEQRDTIALVPGREGVFDGRSPFPAQVVFSPGPLLAAYDAQLYFTFPHAAEIAVFDRADKVTRLIRLSVAPMPVTDGDRARYRDYMMNLPGEDGRPVPERLRTQRERMLALGGFADRFPVWGLMLTDRAGNLWLRRYDIRQNFYRMGPVSTMTIDVPTRWDVIDPRGRWLCTVELPAQFTPAEIGADYVAGVARDADDVEMVRVYRLVKP